MPMQILMCTAMHEEFGYFAKALELKKTSVSSPLDICAFSNTSLGLHAVLYAKDRVRNVSSIGTEASAFALYEGVRIFGPDLVLNCGTAGLIGGDNSNIGEVFLAGPKFYFHDRRIDLPGFDAYGRGEFSGSLGLNLAEKI